MTFNSFSFWLVFPFIFVLYWLVPVRYQKIKKWYLIFVSYLLYMNWKPSFALVLLGVTIITYYGARLVSKDNRRKTMIYVFATLSLLPLLVFKYYNFINDSFIQLLSLTGLKFALPGLNWAVPVGISFFTFQAVGYLFDVYYKRIEPEKSFSDYLLFVSFFPQIMSGPISKASELLPQIKTFKPFYYSQGVSGLKWLLWGMFLKVVIADRMGIYVDEIYLHYEHYSGMLCLLGSVFYSFQIYADFAGYSFMAMGIAKTLGINLINNFNRPYLSISVTDFWRRWHISLSRWLKDYIYIPLGGNRCSKTRNYWNIFVTFLVSGIWHGANWTFIVWGIFHGVAQIIEKALHQQKYEGNNPFIRLLKIVMTFVVVDIAWVFFRMPDLQTACLFLQRIVSHISEPFSLAYYKLAVFLLILIFKDLRDEFFPSRMNFVDSRTFRYPAYLLMMVMILVVGILSSGQFIYVSF